MNADQAVILVIFGNIGIGLAMVYVYVEMEGSRIRVPLIVLLYLAMTALWYFAAGTGVLSE